MSVNVVFTGMYRNDDGITNLSLQERIKYIKSNNIDNIYWYTWKEQDQSKLQKISGELKEFGIDTIQISEPFPHVSRGIDGRQRQIYNIKTALKDFNDRDIILKLRWDIDFNEELVRNIQRKSFFDTIDNGVIGNKIWTGFYSIQEMFSPADTSFAGYVGDLDKIINFQFQIDGTSSNNYVSHDGMMLMPYFISKDKKVCNIIKQPTPDTSSLMFKMSHVENKDYIYAWAYSYYLLHKYFKTGPLGTCYFKRGDMSRWPYSFVDYDRFLYNYKTVVGTEPKLGLYPRYRVYDDIFISRLIKGQFNDSFANQICDTINKTSYEI